MFPMCEESLPLRSALRAISGVNCAQTRTTIGLDDTTLGLTQVDLIRSGVKSETDAGAELEMKVKKRDECLRPLKEESIL